MGSGNILRVHSVQDGHRIDEERLAVERAAGGFRRAGEVDDHH